MNCDPSKHAVDMVNHPPHYTFSKYEPIKVIRAWELNFLLGNAVKYIARAGRKDPAEHIQDLEKARFYLDEEIRGLRIKKYGEYIPPQKKVQSYEAAAIYEAQVQSYEEKVNSCIERRDRTPTKEDPLGLLCNPSMGNPSQRGTIDWKLPEH